MSSTDGFRERGIQVTRTETFVDAAFAFAVTQLNIKLEKFPASSAELWVMLSLLATLCLRDHWLPAWAALPGAVYFLSIANAPLAVRMAGTEPAK
ncbi:MAG: hypothetical protein SGI99_13670 [Pseudomonadota bacterium]|nr:hypothetical protein [Pseudomonadota bacterium]